MNNRIEKILVAVDFSDPSLNALETAAFIAQKCRATLHIIYVQDRLLNYLGTSSLVMSSVTNNAFSILTALSNDVYIKVGIRPTIIEETGHTTETILKSAVENRFDLIVMGTYGASGYRSGYIGTTAYKVVKFAPCPVLLIPPGKKWTSFKTPLFPIRPTMTAFRHYDIIRNFIAEHSTLYILGLSKFGPDKGFSNLNQLVSEMQERLRNDSIRPDVHLSTDIFVPQNILQQVEKNKSDLVIITPALDVSAKHFYIGPNSHYLINNSKVPVLVINKVNVYALTGTRTSL